MMWPAEAKTGPAELDLPTGKVFQSADLACFRSTWQSDAAARPVYLAIKGGNARDEPPSSSHLENSLLHAQPDAGSFIVDGARHRWVIDLGGDDYDLPGYFDHGADGLTGPRWQYYRVRTAGHNTLVIDGHNQDPRARTTILGSSVESGCKWVVYDLSAVYGRPAGSIRRGAALIGRQVVITDEIDPNVPASARRLTVLLLPDCDDAEDTMLPVAPLDYWLARRPIRLTDCVWRADKNDMTAP
jgi:hypothetical protein